MDLDIISFNKQLKEYMDEVKVMEKLQPKESIVLWKKICKFIIEFAKSPKCSRNMKPKMIHQAEIILTKVKLLEQGGLSSVFNDPDDAVNSSSKTSTTSSSSKEQADEEMMATLMALPDMDEPVEEESPGDTPAVDDAPSQPPTDQPEKPDISSTDLSKLDKLDKELKDIPDILKEIKPNAFDNNTIIPKQDESLNLNEFKKDTVTLDITSSLDSSTSSNQEPDVPPPKASTGNSVDLKPSGFNSNALKKTSQDPIPPKGGKDPFGPSNFQDSNSADGNQRLCFACGSTLRPNQQVCSQCRTPNPL
jgi:hypothetical protein